MTASRFPRPPTSRAKEKSPGLSGLNRGSTEKPGRKPIQPSPLDSLQASARVLPAFDLNQARRHLSLRSLRAAFSCSPNGCRRNARTLPGELSCARACRRPAASPHGQAADRWQRACRGFPGVVPRDTGLMRIVPPLRRNARGRPRSSSTRHMGALDLGLPERGKDRRLATVC